MSSAFDIVMESRRKLVDQMITMMETGRVFTKPLWNRAALFPNNPISGVRYRGGNRLRLMYATDERGYQDPRWMTAIQLKKKGFYIRKGESGVLCEKWIFTKEVKKKDDEGKWVTEIITLDNPVVSYFTVFNGEQIEKFPVYEEGVKKGAEDPIVNRLIKSSECPVRETVQPDAYYVPAEDKIYLPPRNAFKDMDAFAAVLIHEMSHSTGHPSRLKREFGNGFGTDAYAKEEMRAELGSLFLSHELGIGTGQESMQDHSDYLESWIKVLKKDANELFRAAADAEKISDRLFENYSKVLEKELTTETRGAVTRKVKVR